MQDSPQCIVFLITSLEFHGRQMQLTQVSLQLKQRGWDVRVISLLPAQDLAAQLITADIPVRSLNLNRGRPDPRVIWTLVQLIRDWQPHILHSHLVHANLLARITRLFVRVPVLISTSGNIYEGGRWRELAYRWTDPLCDLTTNVSQLATQHMVQVGAVPATKIAFVPNQIDVDKFCPNDDARSRTRASLNLNGKFGWLAVGRLETQKDYPNLLQALAQVLRHCSDVLLLICGEGRLRSQLEEMTQALGLDQKVHFLGLRRDIPMLLNAVDAYVMSSAWEGMPGVLLEASAVGLPIVATEVGGNAEVVLEDEAGWLVPPQDSTALAIAMERMMRLSQFERRQMGQMGRRHVMEHYSLERGVERWETLYHGMLSEPVQIDLG